MIKHFFAVPNVHFVLGVNLEELENSVKARYGLHVDTQKYLQKHISINMKLPMVSGSFGQATNAFEAYFRKQSKMMQLDQQLTSDVSDFAKLRNRVNNISLRDIDKLLTVIALLPLQEPKYKQYYFGYKIAISSLCIVKALKPELFWEIKDGKDVFYGIMDFFGIEDQRKEQSDREEFCLWQVWSSFLAPTLTADSEGFGRIFQFGEKPDDGAIVRLINDKFETFSFFINT